MKLMHQPFWFIASTKNVYTKSAIEFMIDNTNNETIKQTYWSFLCRYHETLTAKMKIVIFFFAYADKLCIECKK